MIRNGQSFLQQLKTTTSFNAHIHDAVATICERVKCEGDVALQDYTAQFDGIVPTHWHVPNTDLQHAYETLDADLRKALELSHERITRYQTSIRYQDGDATSEIYEVYRPLNRVGIYVPGGKASYPSTVLMTATLAKVAGVNDIIVVTPPQKEGIAKSVLAACYIAGVTQVFQVGGAQSIAALAYGTETIPKVDKIVGPGNQYVAYAKKYVYGDVGIDQIAGPSEIALIIDETCHLKDVTYDVLAQAEHDEMARTFVISEDEELLKRLAQNIQSIASQTERSAIIQESLAHHHYLIHTANFEESCAVMNAIAPEHASIQTASPERYVPHISYVGTLFLGRYAPEAIGDYIAGPSHVLPTNGTARFQHGLSVNDFLTKHTVIQLTEKTYQQTAKAAMRIAQEEALYNHQHSLTIRKQR
ncbi:histidinol dehydrogenase [Staphylococcus chromogenes]|uniref:histidinol dehydrogenase n=1 Tax=Staphylococcus chromogenes TaxID=46126 RepID=UPI000D0283B8|nr:histidinol dehydrogenase [Staphylococcus chromogenes]PTF58629.1 histidinol dehydrogenase [Staphylococcus chromogenes]PTF76188.1 histidinol dehydrogenase [Staphylococcus chromogenes]PTF92712.1 histidinol dehydrogenase [Staphylococcus chromogenes]PTF98844.1 histidinol dehydrogenase [Staphylococcus chromogenes]PTG44556.1 histidinol dehydrogenase [Staphylococcus chromogenes]